MCRRGSAGVCAGRGDGSVAAAPAAQPARDRRGPRRDDAPEAVVPGRCRRAGTPRSTDSASRADATPTTTRIGHGVALDEGAAEDGGRGHHGRRGRRGAGRARQRVVAAAEQRVHDPQHAAQECERRSELGGRHRTSVPRRRSATQPDLTARRCPGGSAAATARRCAPRGCCAASTARRPARATGAGSCRGPSRSVETTSRLHRLDRADLGEQVVAGPQPARAPDLLPVGCSRAATAARSARTSSLSSARSMATTCSSSVGSTCRAWSSRSLNRSGSCSTCPTVAAGWAVLLPAKPGPASGSTPRW